MDRKKEQILIEKTKTTSIQEGSAYSFMDGFGVRYITPYALAVGANNMQIGYLSSIPNLIGNLSQLFTFKAMETQSRKKIIFWSVFLQSIMWLFLLIAGLMYFKFNIKTSLPSNSIIVIYTLLILFGAFGGPAWASLMRDIVNENRGDYFGKRNRICGAIAIVSMLIAGFILDYFKHTSIFIGFIILFSIAFFGRFVSALLMRKHYDPKFKPHKKDYFSLLQFMKKMGENNFGRFVIYVALITLAVNIAGPFFAVYMLKELNFSYVQFIIITTVSAVSTLIFMPFWGKFSDRYGNLKTMKITGLFIPFIPLFWVLSAYIGGSSIVPFLIIVEIMSGIVWSGFNLSAGNFIYDAVSRQRMAICVSYFNIINGFGVLVGATIGGFISSLDFSFFGFSPILTVIFISAIARFAIYASMKNSIKEVRKVKRFSIHHANKTTTTNFSIKTFFEYLDINFFSFRKV